MSNPHDSKARATLGNISIILEPGGRLHLIAHGREAAREANDLKPMLDGRLAARPWNLDHRHASTVETLDWLLSPFGNDATPAELMPDDEVSGGDVEE